MNPSFRTHRLHRPSDTPALDTPPASPEPWWQQAGLAFTEHEAVGHAGPMIAEMAKKEGCDLIVMGTHGAGMTAALLGSVAQAALGAAKVPVLLVK